MFLYSGHEYAIMKISTSLGFLTAALIVVDFLQTFKILALGGVELHPIALAYGQYIFLLFVLLITMLSIDYEKNKVMQYALTGIMAICVMPEIYCVINNAIVLWALA